uniref:Uncharacterized protein n=1 Tax=Tetranychus urticae TaxID=32264 RepID=T1JYS9_TETUR
MMIEVDCIGHTDHQCTKIERASFSSTKIGTLRRAEA